jgi:hypothetical protein
MGSSSIDLEQYHICEYPQVFCPLYFDALHQAECASKASMQLQFFVEGVSIIHEGKKYPMKKHLGIYKGKGMSWRACPMSDASTVRLPPTGLGPQPMACPNGHALPVYFKPKRTPGQHGEHTSPNQSA